MPLPYTLRRIAEHYPAMDPEWVSQQIRYRTYVGLERKYLYCEVPKAGCTFLKTLIHSIEHLRPFQPLVGPQRETRREMFIHDRGQFALPSLLDLDESMQEYILTSPDVLRFALVRNPYTRLESAWNDKVRACDPNYAQVTRHIKGDLPRGNVPESIVSFEEFVEFISREDLSTCDHHWRLQGATMFLPALNFTFIGRLEQLSGAVDRFLLHARATRPALAPMNRSAGHSSTHYQPELARKVYELYQPDFTAFGYAEDTWQRRSATSPDRTELPPGTVSEAKHIEEIIERNIIIGQLYDIRATLIRRSTVRGPELLDRYAELSFNEIFDQHISRIDGWLTKGEANLLYELAKSVTSGCIVEIGSYRGRSTAALAFGTLAGARRPVFAIDPHDPFVGEQGGHFGPIDRGHFMQRMVELGLFNVVRLINLPSELLSGRWPSPVELLWIDGDHRYKTVSQDIQHWERCLADHANVVFHEAVASQSGPRRVTEELLMAGTFEHVATVDKTVYLRRRAQAAAHGTKSPAPVPVPASPEERPAGPSDFAHAAEAVPAIIHTLCKCADALWMRALYDDIDLMEIQALIAAGDAIALARKGKG